MNSDYFKMLKDVRQAYIQNWNGKKRQDPYKFGDWFRYLTPIERNVWNDIRYLGLPFYPQFPVGKYYIDFADPFEKIALEIDGKIHQDPEVALRDADKTKFLNGKGWRVIRIPGWKTFRGRGRYDYICDDCDHYGEITDQYYTNTAQAVLERIKRHFYTAPVDSDSFNELISSEEVLEIVKKYKKDMVEQRELNKEIFAYDSNYPRLRHN